MYAPPRILPLTELPMSTLFKPPAPILESANGSGDGLISIPAKAHTLAGFRAWVLSDDVPEKLPVSFVQGKVYIDIGQEEIQTHSIVKTECGRVLANITEDIDFGHIHIDGVLVTNVQAQVSNNPDIVAVSYRSLKTGRVRYLEKRGRLMEVEGSPDAVVEIVSNSSVVKDMRELRNAYHLARIPEYWLIDVRGKEIEFQILLWRKSGYIASPVRDGWQHSRTFARKFRLTRKQDRAQVWKYSLEAREV